MKQVETQIQIVNRYSQLHTINNAAHTGKKIVRGWENATNVRDSIEAILYKDMASSVLHILVVFKYRDDFYKGKNVFQFAL